MLSKGRAIVFSLLCVWLASALGAEEKTITWATNPKYPPYDWSVGDSDYDGACKHLLQLIIPDGYKLRAVVYPWARAQDMAREGKIDLLVNLRITPERSQWLEFSQNPSFRNPIAVFMRKDKAIPLNSWDELKPLTGGATIGDSFGAEFDEYLKHNLRIETVPRVSSNFRKLDAGRIDYFVTGYYMGMTWLANAEQKHKIVALRGFVSDTPIHLGFSKRSPHVSLLPEIDKRLAKLAADGTLTRILDDYIDGRKAVPREVFVE